MPSGSILSLRCGWEGRFARWEGLRASEPAGRALDTIGRASEQAGRASDQARRALDLVWWVPKQAMRSTEEAAALGGPRIKQVELWSQLGGPQSQLGGPQSKLGGPQSQLGGPQSQLGGPKGGGPRERERKKIMEHSWYVVVP